MFLPFESNILFIKQANVMRWTTTLRCLSMDSQLSTLYKLLVNFADLF